MMHGTKPSLEQACSIDVAKDEADLLVPVYQALSSLAEQQMLHEIMSQHARDALNASEAIRPQNLYLGQGARHCCWRFRWRLVLGA
jgi:Fe2+ or Zn2+ uptake regulation protein